MSQSSYKDNTKMRLSNIVYGLIFVILAIVIFSNLAMIGKYLPTLLGFILILTAIANLVRSVVLLKNGLHTWWISALPAIIVMVIGFTCLLNPGLAGAAIGVLAGIALLVNGVSCLINFIQFKK